MYNLLDLNIVNVLIWTFLAWHFALKCGYISDDHAVIASRKDIIPDAEKDPTKEPYWVKVFNDGILMYYLNQVMFKLGAKKSPLAWHILSLALHILNVYLLYIFLSRITTPEIALTTCFIWAINPMLNQNVVWISGRPYLLGVTLALVAMIFWRHPLVFMPVYAVAVITNISIGLIPFILKIVYPTCWQPTFYIFVMIFGGGPFILWKFHKRFTKALVIDRENFRWKKRRFNVIARIYGYYIWTILVPIRMGWYHQAGFKYNPIWEKFNIWTMASYIALLYMVKQGLCGWWFFLGILPNANMFATNSFLQDRYVYFGSIGLALFFAPYLVGRHDVLMIIGTFYIVRSYMYSRTLRDDEAMYRENWRNHPNSDYAVNNLSFFLISQKRFEEARVIIMRGLVLNRNNKMLWYNLGVTWASTGSLSNDEGKFRFLRAIDCWKMALQLEPRWKKPSDDMRKLTEFLIENKVISIEKNDSGKGYPTIDIPVLGGILNPKEKDDKKKT